MLTEYVRHSLSETIARLHCDTKGIMHAIAMDPPLEQLLTSALQSNRESAPRLGLAPALIHEVHKSMEANVRNATVAGYQPIVLCVATVRPYFYRLIHTTFPTTAVLSFTELPPETDIEFLGKLEVNFEN